MGNGTETATLAAPEKTMAIVETLAEANEPLGVSAIASQLDYTKSTTYKHLNTLATLGYVEKAGTKYTLTLGFAHVGEHVKMQTPLYQRAKPHIDQLADTTGETAGLVVQQGETVSDVYQATSETSPALSNSRYLHCSAPGKAILATLDESRVSEVARRSDLPAKTENTITDRETLRAELGNIRERGIAFERREQHPDRNCVAVAIEHQSTTAAVYVAGDAARLSGKRLEENVPGMVLSAVRKLDATQATES